MSGRIPKSFIDDLLARCDIVELIDARVPLKKAGRNQVACCPFHNEKTPSFTVSPEKQFYHCFGCGAHGTALGFLMEFDHLSFPEAIETLAALLGLEVPNEDSSANSTQQKNEPLYKLLLETTQFYKKQLQQQPQAIQYLKNRAISGKTAADYMIGFAPHSWDKLLSHLGKSEINKRNLSALGLIVANNKGGYYDRFRNRIIFPIRDSRGRVIAFGGRVIDAADQPKYMNSPESAVFHKGNELYGLYELKQAKQKLEQIIVVEGYMDVVALAEHRINNAVATLGTATSSEHITKLLRICKNLVFCFDGDQAGQQAAWRALENCLPIVRSGHEIQFMFLPADEDPDSFVRKNGKAMFIEQCQQAKSLSNFLFDHLQNNANIDSLEGKAKISKQAQTLIAKVKDPLLQPLLVKQLSQIVGLSEDKLWQAETEPQTEPRPFRNHKQIKLEMNDIRIAIAALITEPALALQISNEFNHLQPLNYPGIPLLLEIGNIISESPDISSAALLQRFAETKYAPALAKLAAYEFVLDSESGNTVAEIFQHAIKQLLHKGKQQRYQELIQKPLNQLTSDEKNELKTLGH